MPLLSSASEGGRPGDLFSLSRCTDALPMIVWVMDGAGQTVHLNSQWHHFAEYDPARSMADNAQAVLHPDDLGAMKDQWGQSQPLAEPFHGEWRLRSKKGHYAWFSIVGTPHHGGDGAVLAWVVVATDIEARRESEKIRRDCDARYQRLLDTSLEGALSVGADDIIGYANPQFANMVGAASAHDLVGCSVYDLLFDEDVPAMRTRRGTRRPDAREQYELRLCRRDGSTCWTWVSVSAETDAATGQYLGTFALFTDITRRKEVEASRDALVMHQRQFLREVLFSQSEGRLHLCDEWDELPGKQGEVTPLYTLSRRSLRDLRQGVLQGAEAMRLALERAQDFETAVGEAAMNAVVHAGGGTGQVFQDEERGLVQVWVTDAGRGITEDTLHRATLERGYSGAETLGHGFWMMLKTADRVYLLTGPQGTTVVLEQERVAPLPSWQRKALL